MSTTHMDASIVQEFIAEAKEHLSTVEGDLLDFEKQMDAPDAELVNRLFRVVHSVKGGAGFLGFARLKDLTHVMESLMGRVRDGSLRATHACLDVLLEASDLMRTMLDNVGGSNRIPIDDMIKRLNLAMEGGAILRGSAACAEGRRRFVSTSRPSGRQPGGIPTEGIPAVD